MVADKEWVRMTDWQFFEQFLPMVRGVCRKFAGPDRELQDFMLGFIAERWPGIDAAFRGDRENIGKRYAHMRSSVRWYACKARRRYKRQEDKFSSEGKREALHDRHAYTQPEFSDEVLFLLRGFSWRDKLIALMISRGFNFAEIGTRLGLTKFAGRSHARRVMEQIRRKQFSRNSSEESGT